MSTKTKENNKKVAPLEVEIKQPQNLEEENTLFEKKDWTKVLNQVKSEYTVDYNYMKPKLDEWAVRLKLHNNQKRDKSAIGDPLLFTVHQTVLASLYSDRLNVSFGGREEGDEEVAENLDNIAVFDYKEMKKSIIDYEWDWDASFFGRGLQSMYGFDRKIKCPTPETIDIMTWVRDPEAKSVNGDMKGNGAMKHGGRCIRKSVNEMRKNKIYFNLGKLKPEAQDTTSLVDQNSQARAEAQGMGDISKYSLEGENATVRLIEWYTHINGKKTILTCTTDYKTVVRYTELDDDFWRISDRPMYPIAHDWDGVSVPDLVEDKQRARAVVQNLGLQGIKINLNPRYVYNTNKIKNRNHLNVEMFKHIPVDGDPNQAIVPVQSAVVKAEADWILNILDVAAQRATATPTQSQGVSSASKRTATEVNEIAQGVDTRTSLSAKIFGWSEEEFWRFWYLGYKDHFADGIDEKIIRISGALGPKWRKLTRENIIAKGQDPDINIESKAISDAMKFNELQKYRLFLKDIQGTSELQTANVRSALRKIGKLSGFDKDIIEQVLPPTIDELRAEVENDNLSDNKKAEVDVYDDDLVHMEVHNKASDTPAKTAHIKAHRASMFLKKINPEMNVGKPVGSQATPMAEGVDFMKPKATGQGLQGGQLNNNLGKE